LLKAAGFVMAGGGLVLWGSPPAALAAGILFTFLVGPPFARGSRQSTQRLLQACVALLGFGMNLPVVLRLGAKGSLFAALTIGATLLLGYWLGPKLSLDRKTSTLLSVGTAICGGSAIAAASSVIAASEGQIAVSIGTIFLLNAVALYLFPLVGHWTHLSQAQFGLWAGIGIHDISSVVGAGMSYGPGALATATAVKLARTLWIVPVTLGMARGFRRTAAPGCRSAKITIPWFIAFFLLASLLRSCIPAVEIWSAPISDVARRGMVLVLFLIGTSLSLKTLQAVGWRIVVAGLALWGFIGLGSLLLIRLLGLAA
jgi:uncharacterized integral membrane protein (TIGR00698 family)